MIDDNYIMPSGEYQGEKLANIPAEYFLWLEKQNWCNEKLKEYINENMDVFMFELKQDNKEADE